MKTTANQKHFLKKALTMITVMLALLLVSSTGIYMLLLKALQEEVSALNMNTASELQLRTEQAIDECNQLASKLILDDQSRLFFTNENPDALINDYSEEFARQLNKLENNYIDSIVLYAPEFQHMLLSQAPKLGSQHLSLLQKDLDWYDLGWIDHIPEPDRLVANALYPRAKKDTWPYLLTLIKHYRSNSMDAVAVINIDLGKLYEHLIYGKQDSVKLYLIDENNFVFLSDNQKSLLQPVHEVAELSDYREKETYGVLHTREGAHFAYMQLFSSSHGFTYATVTELDDYVGQLSLIQNQFTLLICLTSIAAIGFCVLYSLRMRRPLQEIRQLLNDGSCLDQPDEYVEEIQDIVDQIVSHIQTNTLLREELDEKLHLLNDSQMLALQTQINPHFLFNTLNIISLMVENDCGDDYTAVKVLNELSLLLRYALSENYTVRMEEEISYVEKYLNIARYRYEDFAISITVDDDVKDYAVPKLILQPLIENALQHGLASCMTQQKCWLKLQIYRTQYTYPDGQNRTSVMIDLEDNGVGMDLKTLHQLRESLARYNVISKRHIGIGNVSRRLYLLFRNEHKFSIDSSPGKGTRIQIVFPATLPF